MSETVTINLLHVWLVTKVLTAVGLQLWENKVVTGRPLYQTARRFLCHVTFNPELGLCKSLCFIPVWLLSGTKYLRHFMPIETPEPDYKCHACKDTGQILQSTRDGVRLASCSCRTADYWKNVVESYQ